MFPRKKIKFQLLSRKRNRNHLIGFSACCDEEGRKEKGSGKMIFLLDYIEPARTPATRTGSRYPEVIEGNTILGTGYPAYKKKSVMVSDTRGNKSFLPVRMRKTSPLLSLPLSFSPLRASFALRLSIRVIHVLGWRVSTFVSSKNIETTQYRLTLHDQTCASILVGNEAPRLRLFVPRSSS